MKTKKQFSKQILSMFLCVVMLLSYVPISAFAASPGEAQTIPANTDGKYSYYENLTVYYKHNNYLYKAVFSNIKKLTTVGLATNKGKTHLWLAGGNGAIYLQRSAGKYATDNAPVSDLPKTPDASLYLYMDAHLPYATDENKPVVTITCVAVNEPTWTWNGTSSAKAKFTSTDGNATITCSSEITSSTQNAASCMEKNKVTYVATATCNGQKYTGTKIVEGDVGSHNLTYTGVLGATIVETCTYGCGHTATATVGYATGDGTYAYTGSAIKPLKVEYSDGWQGGTLEIAYQNNTTVSTDVSKAIGSITKDDETATLSFIITKGTMSGISVNGYSGVYDRKEHGISITNVPSDATVKYSTSENGTYTTNNPTYTEKGIYEVWYKIEKENYETVFGSANVVISQAANEWKNTPSIAGWTYGETAKTPIAAAKFGMVKVEYRLDTETDADYTTTVPTDAGSYLVCFSVEGTENYTSLSKVVNLEIAKAKLTVTADDKSKTYGESDPALTWQITEGKLVGTDVLEKIAISHADGEDADSYVITVSQATGANPNYDITFKGGTFTIRQKEVNISWGATMSLPYTGSSLVPNAYATNLVAGDECFLTTEVVETADGAGIIPGTWTAKVTALSNDNYRLPESGERVIATFEIVNASQNYAPDGVLGVNETIDGKADGKITGVDGTMEYRRADETDYTAINGTEVTNLADGTYYVRYAAKTYYNASPYKEVVIGAGSKLTVTVPTTQTGYTITTAASELVWNGNTALTFALGDGYSKTDVFAVRVNGNKVELDANSQYVITNAQENITVTVEGVADITTPTAEISIKDNKWYQLLNDITFGLFFKETQNVTIIADDTGSGLKDIYYYVADKEMTADELTDVQWTAYADAFDIDPDGKYVIYAKAVDNAGNVLVISSDGLVLDKTQAVVEGLINGGTYYGQLVFTVADELAGVKSVAIDGADVTHFEGQYVINGDNAEHTVVVTDNADNVTEYKVTVYKNHTVTYKADGKVVSTLTVGHGQNVAFPSIPKKDGYVGKWDRNNENITADTVINAVYTKLADIVPDDVNSIDKTKLEESKKQLQDMLKDGNYTDEDKKDIQDAIDEIDKALAELNEPAKDNSTQTGDSLQLWMWFAVLFVSGSGVFTLIIIHRKRSK